VREAMAAEDSLIKYTRGEGAGAANWDSALHPRAGTPPNPGWFATTGGGHDSSGARFAENQVDSHRIDDVPISDDKKVKPPPDYRIGEPASFVGPSGSKDQPGSGDFWSNVRSAISNWLQELVPEYDLESGQVVGERPRWRALAPYVGIPGATAAIFAGEAAGLSAVLSALGFGGGAVETTAGTTAAASQASAIISAIAQEQANLGVSGLSLSMSAKQLAAYLANPVAGSRFLGTAVHKATARALEIRYLDRFMYNTVGPDFLDTTTGKFIELTTPR
jgi:hypothetical protein